MDLDKAIAKKFKSYTDKQLIDRANSQPDFKWDDEAWEIRRRKIPVKMEGSKLIIQPKQAQP